MIVSKNWEEIQPLIEKEIMADGVPRGEFVVSDMTKAVSRAIQHADAKYQLPQLPALDIGTGTGYHTSLLLALGFPRIFSVDINPTAINFAQERISKLFSDLKIFQEEQPDAFLKAAIEEPQAANFYAHSLNDLISLKKAQYSVVSFNPPILYPFKATEFDKPATHGVYFENSDAHDVKQDLVHTFYQHVAQNNLAKGSHILCVWAGLNRHLVEINPFESEEQVFVHPSEILEHWFNFKFENEPESIEDFYCHTTVLAASFFNQKETGALYTNNIRYGLEHDLYSKMLIKGNEETLAGTKFNFGVLHLVKTSDTENTFKIVNGSSKKEQ